MKKEIESLFVRNENTNKVKIRGGDAKSTKSHDLVNYFEIHGTVPGSYVAAKSHLCDYIHEEFATRSQNIRSEVLVPGDFINFKGYDGLATVTNNTQQPFVLEFGSQLD